MFGIILISVISLLHLYVFGRVATIAWVRHNLPLKYLLAVGLLLWGFVVLSRVLHDQHLGGLSAVIEFIGMFWMGSLFLLFACLLTVDVFTIFGFLFPRLAPVLRGVALVAGLAMSLLALVQGLRPPVVRDYTVPMAGLPPQLSGTKIVAMTDMHLGTQLGKGWLAKRVRQVEALQPDLVVLVGDILDGHDGALSKLEPILRRLHAPLGVWAVLGNHEFYRGADQCTRFLEDSGITVLRNRWVAVQPGLVLAGVDDLTATRHLKVGGDPVQKALTAKPPGATVLLSHTPLLTDKAAEMGVGLMLSGHTHNGQIWPFNYLVRRFYPMIYGAYPIGDMTAIVCRGTGTWGPRMRLWHPGEIIRVTLDTK